MGATPDSADETASLENVLDLTRRICARLGKEPDVNLAELSGKVDKLTLAMEKFASAAKKTGAALDKVPAAQKTVTGRRPRNCSKKAIGKSRLTSTVGQPRSAGIAFDCQCWRWPLPCQPSLCSACCSRAAVPDRAAPRSDQRLERPHLAELRPHDRRLRGGCEADEQGDRVQVSRSRALTAKHNRPLAGLLNGRVLPVQVTNVLPWQSGASSPRFTGRPRSGQRSRVPRHRSVWRRSR